MPSTISVVAAAPLQLDLELKKKKKLLLSATTSPPSPTVISPPPTPTSPTTTTTLHPPTASPPSCKKKRLSCTVNRAPFRKHSTCSFVPDLLACCGSNMRGGLSPPGNGRESAGGSRAGTPLPRFLDGSGNTLSPLTAPVVKGTETPDTTPKLLHRVNHTRSILSLAVSKNYIYAGSQTGEILIWSIETFQRVATLEGHQGSVLCLNISEDHSLLFSSAGDAIINVWNSETFENLYTIYSTFDVGDVFCVAYSSTLQTAYFGAQNTSIQWYDLKAKDSRPCPGLTSHPSHRNHPFFDSKGPGGGTALPSNSTHSNSRLLEIDPTNIIQYAHFGYVYCMLLVQLSNSSEIGRAGEEVLLSGGGDGVVKLWALEKKTGAIEELQSLSGGDSGVLSMVCQEGLLYCGLTDGEICIWDLDTCQLIRTVKSHCDDVLTMSIKGDFMFSGSASGYMRKWNQRFECVDRWESHSGLILTSAITTSNDRLILITGGNDDTVSIWDVTSPSSLPPTAPKSAHDQLLSTLTKLVSFHTISNNPTYTEDCRRGATYLKALFKRFGATATLLTSVPGRNPIVFAKFATNKKEKGKTVLFYGHYDVIHADSDEGGWDTDPFELTGVNGYLYGRGVSDNKGPCLAALFAAGELAQAGELESDIVFLIEGEEESGSRGFAEAVRANKEIIGDVAWILLANSYWLDDEVPCLTYGLRGVIHATVVVESEKPDLHSGVDGSRLNREPTIDLVNLLAKLTDETGAIKIPCFTDPVHPITPAEEAMYSAITATFIKKSSWSHLSAEEIKNHLMSKWRFPSLTIHRVSVSGPSNATIIPRAASAAISLRIVPDQELSVIKECLVTYLESEYSRFKSGNKLSVSIDHEAEPWLGDPENDAFRTLEEAIMEEWSVGEGGERVERVKPLYIREGGSIPTARFLEKEFGAMAAHLPCGQASDHAHLDNERLRLVNLYKSKAILKRVFKELPKK